MASTSSSSTPRKIEYDVYLSFRGEDTRKTFVDHLYKQLLQKEINTFKDDKGLEKGREITELLPIIKESRSAIVVFSKDYASSKWCLEEIATIMECQQQYGEEIMIPIFYDVEPREVGNQTASFGESFAKHEERFQDDKPRVERWKEALKKASEISGYHLKNDFNGYEGECITQVVDNILRRLPPPPSGQQNLVGLKSQLAEIEKLLKTSSKDANKLILGIYGMGGIGKTTLAKAVYYKVRNQFQHFSFLNDVRANKMEDLQLKLLKDPSIRIYDDGISTIQKTLGSKKVLIVLDDVDHKDQLEKLVGDGKWLYSGSRVIITTRNKQLLDSFRVAIKCYDVKKMDEENALELFSRHAFNKEYPDKEFENLSRGFVTCAGGLPLALKVWGSALCGYDDKEFWKATLKKIKSIPNEEICEKLMISYDGLDDKDQKKIFLNIACFFRHKRKDYVKDALESCGLHPGNGIEVLIKRCLLFESDEGTIDMHDLIQDMGWYAESKEKHRSRVCRAEDVEDVLRGKMEPKHIEGFLFSSTNKSTDDEKTLRAVKEMENLKILIVGGADKNLPADVDNFLPSSLRCLEFPHYNSPSLPETFHPSGILSALGFNPSELVVFCLPHSSLLNCRITKGLDNLMYLDLSNSRSLLETPNFELMPNLKRIYLSYCVGLKEIHPSIGHLQQLVLLDLSNCYNLEKLPCFVQVLSLQFLKLEHCGALQNFPEIQTNMPYVKELNLESIPITKLPSSILHLCGLTKLRLCGCEDLVSLPDDLCELESLTILELRDCGELKSLPENLGNLSNLEELHIFDTAIFQLPSSITQLSSLECLCWGGNQEYDEERENEFDEEERSLKFVPSVSAILLIYLTSLNSLAFNILTSKVVDNLKGSQKLQESYMQILVLPLEET
ncbi:PREDICTED: TMV resistance protein N-like [Ipomoea nil]|uniref:TMV resistance protein N-like n=1 Tax=Ipomoea nil TaxID=35883 RepID=UPI000900FF85|nr:PREDICTED: TMV resistance protein N-like [Ipomoea nil]